MRKWIDHYNSSGTRSLRKPYQKYAKEFKIRVVQKIYDRRKGIYGYRRITLEMENDRCTINYKTVSKLMCTLGLKSLIRRKNIDPTEER